MEQQQYDTLINFIDTGNYPDGYTEKQKQQLQKAAKYFTIHHNTLYHNDGKDLTQLQRVVKKEELETVLYNSHDNPLSGHLKFEATYNQINQKYYWYGMKKMVQDYVDACEVC